MAILVTGGAGYIGSHTVAELKAFGDDVVVLDNLSTGHREAVLDVPFYHADIRDEETVTRILRDHEVDIVVHFAANSLVGESVADPLKYFDNNVAATTQLVRTMTANGVKRIVFSSTAAVYGEPAATPIVETMPTQPTNPYGDTKLTIEHMLQWCHNAYGLDAVALRYFNAAGAHPALSIGEDHQPETHLIPLVLQTALGQRAEVAIYGDDYPTPDGTCIRDYVHVMDLASAHRLAVQSLRERAGFAAYNLGNGQGFSVREVLAAARDVTGRKIPATVRDRRAGDPAILVASAQKARSELGWVPLRDKLTDIVASAWEWHVRHPQGY